MGKIRINSEELKYMTLFETMTGATIKDCIQEDESIGFVVKKGDMGLAIGKAGANIERVKRAFGKDVWVTEFSDDLSEFIKNIFQPTRIRQIRVGNIETEKVVTLEVSKKDTKKVIGHNGNRIRMAKKLVDRHFSIDDIKIKSVY
jgi:N utilization substance protein A